MDSLEEKIHLSAADSYITENPGDAFRVKAGSVLVYVAPMKSGRPDRRQLLCEIPAGRLIPALSYKDEQHTSWRFILVARDEADLELLLGRATSVLYRGFAAAAGLDSYEREGFNRSAVEFYRREALKDNIYIGLGEKNRPSVDIASYGLIRSAFEAEVDHIDGSDPLYRAMAFACRENSISLIDASKASAACAEELSVPVLARASRIGCRAVNLDQGWYRRDSGTIIGAVGDEPVACVPRGQGSYTIYFGKSGRKEKLTDAVAETVDTEAYILTRTLPERKLTLRDLVSFALRSIRRADLVWAAVLGLVGALIGILLPTLNQLIYDEYIPLGNYSQLLQICTVIGAFMIGNLFFDMVKRLSEYRISCHVGYDLQNAVYSRIFHLPESFFREYESADLAQRLFYISGIANTAVTSTLVSGLASVFSLLYLYHMFRYSSRLAWMALMLLLIYELTVGLISRAAVKYDRQIEENKGEASAKLYQFLNGIEKIRMAGVEDRAAYEYMKPFSQKQSLELVKNRFSAYRAVLSGAVSIVFSMVFYYIIVRKNVNLTTGGFMAFNSAFGSFSASILNLFDGAISLYLVKPMYERIKPVFATAPEDDGARELPGRLEGGVSLHNVRFAYVKDGPNVLDGINLRIAPGEYLGIVGSSGCGKSTLLKLLLGFEKPDQGQVCYDGKNLQQLDRREVRKNLGAVLQNSRLIAGSILENITITSPRASMKEVMQVIEAVGLKEEIDQMPMGIYTLLNDNSDTISGGQRQRILIARAIISHPAILIFDEATSALDNVTQAAVCASLDKMNVTRIVVAHRLSTIKNCDRIIVLQEGKIAEEGNYASLMEKNGIFSRFAARQLVD